MIYIPTSNFLTQTFSSISFHFTHLDFRSSYFGSIYWAFTPERPTFSSAFLHAAYCSRKIIPYQLKLSSTVVYFILTSKLSVSIVLVWNRISHEQLTLLLEVLLLQSFPWSTIITKLLKFELLIKSVLFLHVFHFYFTIFNKHLIMSLMSVYHKFFHLFCLCLVANSHIQTHQVIQHCMW